VGRSEARVPFHLGLDYGTLLAMAFSTSRAVPDPACSGVGARLRA
jgi:hypothetical protein